MPLAGNTPLAASDQIFSELLSARDKFQEMKREAAALSADAYSPTDPKATAARAFNPVRDAYLPHYRAQVLARAQSAALTTRPFAERLVHFWTNHFAVSADKGAVYGVAGTLENEAIRPHVDGRFVDLPDRGGAAPRDDRPFSTISIRSARIPDLARLAARRAEARPFYRQRTDAADKPRREFGINENLAREILELHTLGVNGGYTQNDVTTFAQIITGWSIGGGKGRLAGGVPSRFYFRDNLHEPGAKTFMGKTYYESGLRQGEAVLRGSGAASGDGALHCGQAGSPFCRR